MKIIIVYRSYSGFTEKYANWIGEELQVEVVPISRMPQINFAEYQTIIFGGSLHMVGISGIKQFKSRMAKLTGKQIVVFAVGASPSQIHIPRKILELNFSAEEQKSIPFFYFRGGFNFQKLNFLNKCLMMLFKWKLQLKKNKTPDELGMIHAYKVPMDSTNRESIQPLLKTVR